MAHTGVSPAARIDFPRRHRAIGIVTSTSGDANCTPPQPGPSKRPLGRAIEDTALTCADREGPRSGRVGSV